MASSSSSTTGNSDGYNVFLSFRGTDTRNNFISHLYDALCRAQIEAFIDYKLDRGEEITPTLERVIEGAKISIIVFSPDYASSTFCLDELVKIMECKEAKGQIVFPIFYKVYPAQSTYEESFAKHKTIKKVENWTSFVQNAPTLASNLKAFEEETIKQAMKVESWKSAFHKALELAGWHIDGNSVEAKIIGKITREVLDKLNSSQSRGEEVMSISMVGQRAEDNLKRIWECLMNDGTSRIGICGMGGIGKTTIATHINNRLLKDANSFTHIYWVTVSKDSSIYKLQSGIARKMNLDLSKEDDEKKRAVMIRNELSNKKFLLILDDVWEAYELTKDVGIPFFVGRGKLLLTTRYHRLCRRMQCQSFQVEPLCKREAWDLFIEESRCEVDDDREWRKIVESIVKQCAGLPLAIIVIARRMRGIDEISEWRNTLRELEKPCEGENYEMEEKVFKPLKFSYDHLPNDKYRQCFLFVSLFPEDYEIPRNKLVDYWMAEGLMGELDSIQAEKDLGNHIIDELISASLFEYANKRTHNFIKMHDVIRDMAHFHLKVGLQFQHPLKEFEFGRIEVMDDTISRSLPNMVPICSKLGTLLLRGDLLTELPRCSIADMQRLTILEMHGERFSPNSIDANLKNLRMLSIASWKSLYRIPSLAEFENLRHLKIVSTSIREIPQGLERLLNLRVLNLSKNCNLGGSFPSAVLEKLSNLQSLMLNGTKLEVELDALNGVKKLEMLRLSFPDVHKLNSYVKSRHWRRLVEYHINYSVRGIDNWLDSYKKSMFLEEKQWTRELDLFFPDDVQCLLLRFWDSSMLGALRNRTFADLQILQIKFNKGSYLFTPALAQHLLHKIKELEIMNSYELKEIIATEEKCFNRRNYNNYPTIVLRRLKRLILHGLFEVRSIYSGRMICRKLEHIRIYRCKKLNRLPFCIEEESNRQNPTIKLECDLGYEWLDSLRWDNSNAKSMYQIQRLPYPFP